MPSTLLTALIIATALFMENMDGTVISTSLPAIARDLHVDPIVLKLALTSYRLRSRFIPVSGWFAAASARAPCFARDRRVHARLDPVRRTLSLPTLIAARVLQGMGGAMMVPVGRLVLLRSVRESDSSAPWPISRSGADRPDLGRRSAASSPPISTGAGSSLSTSDRLPRHSGAAKVHPQAARGRRGRDSTSCFSGCRSAACLA